MACENGCLEIAELLMQKSAKLKIELNAKDFDGHTAFHLACKNGHSKIEVLLMQKYAELKIELNENGNAEI